MTQPSSPAARPRRGGPAPSGQDLRRAAEDAMRRGAVLKAETLYAELAARHPDDVEARLRLGLILMDRRQTAAAAREFHAVLSAASNAQTALRVEAEKALTNIRLRSGDYDAARALIASALAREAEEPLALVRLAMIERPGPEAPLTQRLRDAFERAQGRGKEQGKTLRLLLTELGHIHDRAGDYASAFDFYARANDLNPHRYDPAAEIKAIEEFKALFTPSFFARSTEAGAADKRMIFVLGMPRSGSTLIEQLIAATDGIGCCGERPEIELMLRGMHAAIKTPTYTEFVRKAPRRLIRDGAAQYLGLMERFSDKPNARRLIDKMPSNFLRIGFIAWMFPNARIVHSMRHPLDTCLSCYVQNFESGHGFTADQRALTGYFQRYQDLMRHWREALGPRLIDVRYEALTADPAGEGRALYDALGLNWSDAALERIGAGRFIQSASHAQARGAIHDRSAGRWRNYEAELAPLIDALGGIDAIEAGYAG